MHEIELSAGRISYADSGGTGPVAVLLHGALMSGTAWSGVVEALGADVRCVVPTLPMGAHREAMRPDADVSPRGVARLVGELLERLELEDVTLVGNDTGGALAQLLVTSDPARIARLVLVSCDAFDNFPPGLPGRICVWAARVPGGLYAAMLPLRVPVMRRLPVSFGWLAKRPIAHGVFAGWLDAFLRNAGVRRDAVRFLRAVDRRDLQVASDQLASFDRPALVVWASQDKVMPPEHGRRLADLLPQGRLVEIDDSYTLIPLDQPVALADALREFMVSPC